MIDFSSVESFEKRIASFFGSKHAVAVDSCTHGIELSLRYTHSKEIVVPARTYISVPFLANKLNIGLKWNDQEWKDFYYLTDNVIDAAVLWKKDSYISGTLMSLSFQYKKHLNLGRGGVILTDSSEDFLELKKMSYDGRIPGVPWREQDIESFGYHYYMTPETAELGLSKIDYAISEKPRQWVYNDWPDLRKMKVFQNEQEESFYHGNSWSRR